MILKIGNKNLSVKLAKTPEQRAQGLMFVEHMPEHEGMLFVMDTPEPVNFWMKNTLIPLDIAYLQQDMRVVKIDSMQPIVGKSSCEAPIKYVIEANAGWFANAGLKQGDVIDIENVQGIGEKPAVTSAGFVIVDFSDIQPKALCLLSSWHIWGFPKGQVENGENLFEAACRETEEEAGLRHQEDFQYANVRANPVTYPAGKFLKTAHYFFAEKISDTKPFLPINPVIGKPEHIAWRWMPVQNLQNYLPKSMRPVINDIQTWCDNV